MADMTDQEIFNLFFRVRERIYKMCVFKVRKEDEDLLNTVISEMYQKGITEEDELYAQTLDYLRDVKDQ